MSMNNTPDPHKFPCSTLPPLQTILFSPLTVTPNTPLKQVIKLIAQSGMTCPLLGNHPANSAVLTQGSPSCIVVVDDDKPIGIFTERELVTWVADGSGSDDVAIATVMQPIQSMEQPSACHQLCALLVLQQQQQVQYLPIVDADGHLVGMLNRDGVKRFFQSADLLRFRQIREVMNQQVIQAPPTASLQVIAQLMAKHQVNCVAITETVPEIGVHPVGIITAQDVVPFCASESNLHTTPAQHAMHRLPITLKPDESLWDAHQLILQHPDEHLLITNSSGTLLGMVTVATILKMLNATSPPREAEQPQPPNAPLATLSYPLLQRQALLIDPRRELDRVLNSVQDVIWSVSLPNFEVRYVNAAAEKLYHQAPAMSCHRSPLWWTLIHAEDRDRILNLWLEARENQRQGWDVEYRIIRSGDGQLRWVNDRAHVILGDEGQPLHIDGITTDITDRKILDLHLRSALQDLSCYKLALDEFALVARINPNGIITQVNERFCQVSCYTQDELLGKSIAILKADDHSDELLQDMWSTLQQGNVWQGEVKNRTKDNTDFWVNQVVVPFPDSNGSAQQYLTIQTDITEKKQAEEHLRQANEQLSLANVELARATRLKDEFLASMSHELRTPLTSILGMSDVLQERVFGALNEKQYQYIDIISQSGKHLLSLINDILDLAKIESGKLDLHISPISVQDLCESSLSFVQQMAHTKQINLNSLISNNIEDIQVDELRIRQALINLLSNAVKFTSSGGDVTLSVKCDRDQGIIQFSVSDTGIGIAPEDMKKLFQAFVQIDSNLNRQYNGTGLGLALVKRIAELHLGDVTVESTLGKGSCFTINLPYISSKMQNPTATPLELLCQKHDPLASAPSFRQPLVLLAEDNQANINAFSDYLMSYGYRLLIATHGQEAIEMTRAHHPDLVLMDIQMPGIDGLEATRQIRATPQVAKTPIIALTALAMSGDRDRCLAAGVTDYLTKPVILKHLIETIQKYCKHKVP